MFNREQRARTTATEGFDAVKAINKEATVLWGRINSLKNTIKCDYADRYKAKRKPTCGCYTCDLKYANARIAHLEKAIRKAEYEIETASDYVDGTDGILDTLADALKD
jgi:hypothetical protein